MHMTHLTLNPHIAAAPLYTAGTSIAEIQRKYGLSEVIKLASNENCLGPSPKAVEAMQRSLADMHRYPPFSDDELRDKLAAAFDGRVSAECFVTGNGSCDVLGMIVHAFIGEGDEAIISPPTFPVYEILVKKVGGRCVFADLEEDFSLDLDKVLGRITDRTRLIFVCNPNNPTGTTVSQAEVEAFMARVPPSVLVIFDEAYGEFVDRPDFPDTLAYVEQGRNALICKTFSKIYGLAGLRVGYAIAPDELAQYIRRLRLPFHTNTVAMAGAIAALDDAEFVQRSAEHNRTERQFLYRGFTELELPFVESQSNFIITRPAFDAGDICRRLMERGVILRPMDGFRAPECMRITIGTRAENQRLLEALGEVFGELRSEATSYP